MDFVIVSFCRTMAACGNGGTRMMPLAEYKKLMESHLAKLESELKNSSEDYRQVFVSSKKLFQSQYELIDQLQHESDNSTLERYAATHKVIASAEAASPAIYAAWINEESLLEKERLKEQRFREKLKQLVLWSSVVDFLLAVALISFFVTNITRRLNLLMKNAKVLPASTALPYEVKGEDEIAVLDQAMHEASAELISAAEYRRSLLEMMAHDLRNPLMSIGLAFDVMLKTSREGQVAVPDKRVRSLRHSLDQITALLEDLLTPDRMESTKLELDLSLVKADELVSDACDFVRTQCDAKSITIESTIDDASVIADHNRLMQVLSNFIGNAIRYSPAGSTVKVSVLQKNGRVRFAVADQGPGIPGALQGKLFEKYFQIPQGKKAVASTGYGLGLSICKQIITSHHGQIGVDSEVGRGSTFWFELPLDDDDDDDDDVN